MNFINRLIILICIAITSNLYSCKKDSKSDFIIQNGCDSSRIDSIESFGVRTPVKYDNFNRIIKLEGDVFEYTMNKVNIVNPTSKNVLEGHTEIILNSQGNASSSTRQEINRVGNFGVVQITKEADYTYSQDGYLIKEFVRTQITDLPNSTSIQMLFEWYFYEFVDGNLMRVKYKNSSNTEIIWDYTFTELPNFLDKFGRKTIFKGKQSKNLIKKATRMENGISEISDYTYKINKNGLLGSQTIITGANINTKEFLWNCR